MKYAIRSFALFSLLALLWSCGCDDDDSSQDDASVDAEIESGTIITGDSGTTGGSGGTGGTRDTRDTGVSPDDDAGEAGEGGDDGGEGGATTDGGQQQDAAPQPCAYDCVSESFCSGDGTYLIEHMTCTDPDEVCCSLKPECTHACMTEESCTSQSGTEHDMACPDEGDVCCDVPPACEYECVPSDYCTTSDGLEHNDQNCAEAGDICCEIDPACTYDCVPQTFCDNADGTVHEGMVCEDSSDVCCEPPTATYCDTCVPPGDCGAGQVIAGEQCLDDTMVCCNQVTCNSVSGTCRFRNIGCTRQESETDQYLCPGPFVCCMPDA